jgi:NAD(P)-dependent dehydrogenase (short-subunit alcohol dehydrogenase family)
MEATASRPLAVVTGASSGIGLELAKQFASNGFDVIAAAEDAAIFAGPLDAVALNAGIGAGGAFASDTELEQELRLVDLNVRSTVHLAKYVVRDMLDTRIGASGSKDDPADVARDGFEALMAGKERVVASSMSTKVQGRASRFMPDSANAAMHRRMAEPGSGKR